MGNNNDKSKFNLLYKTISSELKTLLLEYNFLFEKDKDLEELFKELLFEIYVKNDEEEKKFYIKNLRRALDIYINKNRKNQSKIFQMINNYINKNFINELNNLKISQKLQKLIQQYNLYITPDTSIELLKINKKLSLVIKYLIDNNIKFPEDSAITMFIEVYYMLNNLKIDKDESLKKEDYIKDTSSLDCISAYLTQINKPILTQEEEIELFKRIEKGDSSAKNKVIENNLRWVVKLAKKYQYKGLDLEDLIQEGNIGLMIAVDKYDYKKGFRFTTYATHWIKQKIRRAIQDTGASIKLPNHLQDKIQRYELVENELTQKLGREVTAKEIASVLNMSIEEIENIKLHQVKNRLVSLNTFIDENKETELEELILKTEESAEEYYIENKYEENIMNVFEKCNLTDNEIKIMSYLIGINGEVKKLTEISEMIGITRERTRQLQNKALKKIRQSGQAEELMKNAINPTEAKRNLELYRKYYKENPKSLKSLQKDGGAEELEIILKTKTLTKLKEITK